jgi:hypothetical protein
VTGRNLTRDDTHAGNTTSFGVAAFSLATGERFSRFPGGYYASDLSRRGSHQAPDQSLRPRSIFGWSTELGCAIFGAPRRQREVDICTDRGCLDCRPGSSTSNAASGSSAVKGYLARAGAARISIRTSPSTSPPRMTGRRCLPNRLMSSRSRQRGRPFTNSATSGRLGRNARRGSSSPEAPVS